MEREQERESEHSERRKHSRIPLKLSMLCQKAGLAGSRMYSGSTVNVSPGGMLVEMHHTNGLAEGELVNVEVTVPPTEGLLEFGGSISSYARILRVGRKGHLNHPVSTSSVALEFCQPPRYRF